MEPAEAPQVPEELVALLDEGVAAWLATHDADLFPEAVRIWGARVGPDRRTLTLYVPDEQAGRTFDNARENGQLAAFFCRMTDYRAAQVKGELIALRPTSDTERERQAEYARAFVATSIAVGTPREPTERLAFLPSTAVDLRVREVYVQTPGPGAGLPWR
jgi:hypothetical protein